MQISLRSLKKFIPINHDPEALARTLDMLGIEVELIEHLAPSFAGVIVARVEKTAPHPDAERLSLAEVFDGKKRVPVVCAAPNCRPGLFAFAPLGAELFLDGKKITIGEATLRGERSCGMLVSEDELGLTSAKSEGIWELNSGESPGDLIAPYFTDTIFHISLTPNLAHCQSLYGIARELSAALNLPLAPLPEPLEGKEESRPVMIEGPGCRRYTLTEMEIKPMPTPLSLRGHLHSHGMRAVNLPVDCTNYIMTTYGLPTHAFDSRGFDTISVGPVTKTSLFKTLDGKERTLEEGDIAIFNEKRPIAIAGIMGGASCEVRADSSQIAFEAAVFESALIRRTSRRLGLRTDSSARFERGADPEMPLRAASVFVDEMTKAGALIGDVLVSGAKVAPFEPRHIQLRPKRVRSLLGIDISDAEITSILESLELFCSETFNVTIPSFRADLVQEIDLIEEVARLYGYDKFPQANSMATLSPQNDDLRWSVHKKLQEVMIRLGAQEMMTCNLISEEMLAPWSRGINLESCLRLKNASVVQYSWLRPSLLPGLCQAARRNIDHGTRDLFAFEIGAVHMEKAEPLMLSFIMTGAALPPHFSRTAKPLDFLDLKARAEELVGSLPLSPVTYTKSEHPSLHPHAQAALCIGECTIGHIGRAHPLIEKALGSPPLFVAEISIDDLISNLRPKAYYEPICTYPSTKRDWTLSLDKEMPYSYLEKACLSAGGALLTEVELVSTYEGENLKRGFHNLSIRLTYQKASATLSHEEAERAHTDLQSQVTKDLAPHLA